MDERVKGEYRKIYSELTSLIMVVTALSVLIQFFFFDAGPGDCVTEMVILIGSPVYLTARQFMMGIDPEDAMPEKKRKKRFWASLLGGLLGFLLVLLAKQGTIEGWAVEYLISFGVAFAAVYVVSTKLGKYFSGRKRRKYED